MTSTHSSPPAPGDDPPGRPARRTPAAPPPGIAIVLVAQLMLVLDATVVNVALPRIDADLGFGPASLSWVLNAYTLAFGGLLLLGGRLGDVFGRRRLFEVGLAVFTLASLLGGLAQTPELARRRPRPPGRRRRPGRARACSPCSPPAPRRGRPQPGARALRRRLLRRRVHRPAARRRCVTDLGSWRWTLFINVPDRAGGPRADAGASSTRPRAGPDRFDVVGALTATVRRGRRSSGR